MSKQGLEEESDFAGIWTSNVCYLIMLNHVNLKKKSFSLSERIISTPLIWVPDTSHGTMVLQVHYRCSLS